MITMSTTKARMGALCDVLLVATSGFPSRPSVGSALNPKPQCGVFARMGSEFAVPIRLHHRFVFREQEVRALCSGLHATEIFGW